MNNFNADAFKVSVIIPVYNAAPYVRQAVESALVQAETGEVILIEDGSPDGALAICQELSAQYPQVRLFQHPNGENRGAGASRNLGMMNAKFGFIAFLDADDYYLPNRFRLTSIILTENPECEGVYEAVGFLIENESSKRRFTASLHRNIDDLITIIKDTPPQVLGKLLISGGTGTLHLDGITVRKSVIKDSGLMEERLRLHQDTEWIIRCALSSSLFPGNLIEPVALARIHDQNRFFNYRSQSQEYHNRMNYWLSLYRWSKAHAPIEIQRLILDQIIVFVKSQKYFQDFPRQFFPARLIVLSRLVRLFGHPELIKDMVFSKQN